LACLTFGHADSSPVQVGALELKIPGSWKKEQPTSSMRAAQFAVQEGKEKIEYIVYYFGGGGGGIDANINRWIGQFATEGRTHERTQGESKNGPYHLVDIQGTFNKSVGPPMMGKTTPVPGSRVLAAVVQTAKGSYFIKFIGTQDTIKKHKNDFLDSFGVK
jgi:hypothetical protein